VDERTCIVGVRRDQRRRGPHPLDPVCGGREAPPSRDRAIADGIGDRAQIDARAPLARRPHRESQGQEHIDIPRRVRSGVGPANHQVDEPIDHVDIVGCEQTGRHEGARPIDPPRRRDPWKIGARERIQRRHRRASARCVNVDEPCSNKASSASMMRRGGRSTNTPVTSSSRSSAPRTVSAGRPRPRRKR
jgi:hypothetical protein